MTGVKVDYDPTYLRDILVLNDIHVAATWGRNEYAMGTVGVVKIDISEDSVVEKMIEVLQAELLNRQHGKLKRALKAAQSDLENRRQTERVRSQAHMQAVHAEYEARDRVQEAERALAEYEDSL